MRLKKKMQKEKFERLESLVTKMKQYESFFRAAPEAFLQITYRIVSWENDRVFESEGDILYFKLLMLFVFKSVTIELNSSHAITS